MKPFFKKSARSAACIIAIAFVFVGVFSNLAGSLGEVRQAHAAFPVFETNPAVVGGVVATSASTLTQTTIMQVLNGLAWSVAKMTIQSITRSTVNWINSGFNGSPAFVSDLRQNLQYLGDAVANDFLNHLNTEVVRTTGFNITTPFQDQLNHQLRAEYYRTTGSWGLNYTLSQTSKDPKAFLNGSFSQGGFNAYFSANGNPANNPFGAYKLASDQLWAQVDAAAQQRKAELNWGQGFLPWRGSCNTQAKGNAVTLSTAEKCPFNAVRTPGSIIEQSLGITVTSPLRQLELADSINEIVAALMGQLVNQVLGPGGLTSASQPTSGGGQSFLNQATDPSQYNQINATLSDGVVQSIKDDQVKITAYRDGWQQILDAANAAQQMCGARPDIAPVITQAQASVTKGNSALSQINNLISEVQSAASTSGVDKSSKITQAVTDYQSYLASPNIPNATERADAAIQSADTSDSTSTPSTLTKMKSLQNSCGRT